MRCDHVIIVARRPDRPTRILRRSGKTSDVPARSCLRHPSDCDAGGVVLRPAVVAKTLEAFEGHVFGERDANDSVEAWKLVKPCLLRREFGEALVGEAEDVVAVQRVGRVVPRATLTAGLESVDDLLCRLRAVRGE